MVELVLDKVVTDSCDESVVMDSVERPFFRCRLFKTAMNLITIDAPDGSGKGEIASLIHQQLSLIYGQDNVLLVSPNSFRQCPEALEVGKKLKSQPDLSPSSVRHNSHFMAATMINYKMVIAPALKDEKIIVVDSSEIRSLAYMLDRGSVKAIESTYRWIKSGRATAGILAGNRVLVSVSPRDCLANIDARGKRDYGDPANVDEAIRRANCYALSVSCIKDLRQDDFSNWINVQNPRVEVGDVRDYLSQLVSEKIISRLRL